jgi:hypothetical protein
MHKDLRQEDDDENDIGFAGRIAHRGNESNPDQDQDAGDHYGAGAFDPEVQDERVKNV